MRIKSIILLLFILLAGSAHADEFNASIYVKFTAPDGSVYETRTRRVLAEGEEEELTSTQWGVLVSFYPVADQLYRVRFRFIEKDTQNGGMNWLERSQTEIVGQLGALVEYEFNEQGIALESALFVSQY